MRLLLASLVLGFLISACSLVETDDKSARRYFTAQVDSISILAAVSASDTLSIQLHGWLGNHGCYRFERFEVARTASTLDLAVIGSVPTEPTVCPDVMVPLPARYEVAPPLGGPFHIVILQPDGSALERVVHVEDDA